MLFQSNKCWHDAQEYPPTLIFTSNSDKKVCILKDITMRVLKV